MARTGRPPAWFVLPDGRVVRGAAHAAAALGISRARLYQRAPRLDARGRWLVDAARPSGAPGHRKEPRP